MSARLSIMVFAVLMTLAPSRLFAGFAEFIECEAAPPPSVQTFWVRSVSSPGGAIIILGTNFNPIQGQILINLKTYQGQPLSLPLQITAWGDQFVAGLIPAAPTYPPYLFGSGIWGVEAQTATFEVSTWCKRSTTISAPFTPAMDVQQLPAANISCSMTNHNS